MKSSNARSARFGPYTLDLRSGELRKFDSRIRIGEQSFRILCLLLEANGEMVTREELRSQLWPGDTFVDFDHGLNSAVQRLRDCLSDSADKPRWIETVPRRGYRFIGQVDFQEDSGKSTDPAVELSSSRAEPPSGEAAPSPVLPNITIRTSEVAPSAVELPSPAAKRQTSYVVPALAFAVFVMVAITLFAVRYRLFAKSVPTQVHSIAVIPLNNISPDHDQEYFADGMTDELITMLAKNTSLRVVSRTSAMQYKGVNRPVREIARELGVDAVLEGSILRDGNHVHLNVQLVYAPTDSHIWAESYDRDLSHAFLLPSELSQTIAKQVQAKTSTPARPQRYINPEARDAYLHGRYFWLSHSVPDTLPYFQKAIELQPDYAAAWAGLSDTYSLGGMTDDYKPQEAKEKAEAAVRKAVELDDSIVEVHTSLGAWYYFYAWDLNRAESECRRGIEIDPENPDIHYLCASIFVSQNRVDEAIAETKRSAELGHFARAWGLGEILYCTRQYDAAIAELKMQERARPGSNEVHFFLAQAYFKKGMYKEFEDESEKMLEVDNQPAEAAVLRKRWQRGGLKLVMQVLFDNTKKAARRHYISGWELAIVAGMAGDKEQTLQYLESAYHDHYPNMVALQWEPTFDLVHSDPSYVELVKKVGLQLVQ